MNEEISKMIVDLMEKCADEEVAISLCAIGEDGHVALAQGGDLNMILNCVSEQADEVIKEFMLDDDDDEEEFSEEDDDFFAFLNSIVERES